jgi:uncharacterized membrane protein
MNKREGGREMKSAVSTRLEAAAEAIPAPLVGGRLTCVDFLRGTVMVLMILDHVREFLGDPTLDPTDVAKTTLGLFLTRWVTHFCAPVFVFLAGAGAYLARALGKSRTSRGLARYLAGRGLFLVFLELTVVRWGWNFNFHYHFVLVQVIWVIGLSMIALAGLVALGLPSRWVGALGAMIVAGHNLFDLGSFAVAPSQTGHWNWLWHVLLRPGGVSLGRDATIHVAYPLLPWFGVMALGFGFGEVLALERRVRSRVTFLAGLALLAGFVVLRAVNSYGDPAPWQTQDSTIKTVLSFLNCQKYPPSLLYVLMTLGPGLMALAACDFREVRLTHAPGPTWRGLVMLGRVPLFFYVVQWPVIHMMANLASLITGPPIDWFAWSFDYPRGYGYSLPVIYTAWALSIAILYLPCRHFAGLKQRNRDVWWLHYL